MLEFKPHPNYPLAATKAEIHFPNGYGASVITGEMFYTSAEKPYELAVLDGDKLTYKTPITDDVIGYLDYDEVLDILSEIKKLPPKEGDKMKVKVAKGITNFTGILVKCGKKFNTYKMLSHEFQRLVGMLQTYDSRIWYVTKDNIAGVVMLGDEWPTAELIEVELITGGTVLVKWSVNK